MEFASLPKTGAVTQGVIYGHVKIHRTTVDFVSICYVCETSAVHSNDFSNRQQLSQAENALLIFDYYRSYMVEAPEPLYVCLHQVVTQERASDVFELRAETSSEQIACQNSRLSHIFKLIISTSKEMLKNIKVIA